MDPFQYVAYNNSKGALDLLSKHSRLRVRNEKELADALKSVYGNLRIEDKEDFLISLRDIHPDQDLFENPEPSKEHACNCEYCQVKNGQMLSHVIGTHVGANGQQAVSHFLSSGEANHLLDNSVSNDVNAIKQENTLNKAMNDKLFKILVISFIGIVVYKYIVKK